MKSEWRTETFESAPLFIEDGDRGKNYPKREEFTASGHCVFLNTGNVTPIGFDFSEVDFISQKRDQLLRKGKLVKNDSVLTTRGTVGNVGFFDDSIKFEHVRINSGMVIVRPDPQVLDPRYVYLYLRSSIFKGQVDALRTGSAQPQLPIRDIKRICISYPSLEEQKKIAHVLGTLDDKIELNRQMNETLEAMAQALFKSWFVDFDPVIDNALAAGNEIPEALQKRAAARQALGEQHKSLPTDIQSLFPDSFVFTDDMGWVPEGWDVKSISELAEKISKGTTPRKSDLESSSGAAVIPFLKVRDISDDGIISHDGLELIPLDVHSKVLKRSILKTGDVLFSIAGTIGRCTILPPELNNANTNQAVAFVRLNEASDNIFVSQLLKSKVTQDIVNSKLVQAVQANFSLTELGNLNFVWPKPDLLDIFNRQVGGWASRVEGIQRQNRALVSVRDALLPKLLSGELRIPDAEKQVAEAV